MDSAVGPELSVTALRIARKVTRTLRNASGTPSSPACRLEFQGLPGKIAVVPLSARDGLFRAKLAWLLPSGPPFRRRSSRSARRFGDASDSAQGGRQRRLVRPTWSPPDWWKAVQSTRSALLFQYELRHSPATIGTLPQATRPIGHSTSTSLTLNSVRPGVGWPGSVCGVMVAVHIRRVVILRAARAL